MVKKYIKQEQRKANKAILTDKIKQDKKTKTGIKKTLHNIKRIPTKKI